MCVADATKLHIHNIQKKKHSVLSSYNPDETKVLPHTVGVELELGLVNHPQSIKLVGQCTLAHHELGSVGSI